MVKSEFNGIAFKKKITYTLLGLNDDIELDIIDIPLIVGIKALPLGIIDLRLYTGVAIVTMAKGGLMYEASVGGQKFEYEAVDELKEDQKVQDDERGSE